MSDQNCHRGLNVLMVALCGNSAHSVSLPQTFTEPIEQERYECRDTFIAPEGESSKARADDALGAENIRFTERRSMATIRTFPPEILLHIFAARVEDVKQDWIRWLKEDKWEEEQRTHMFPADYAAAYSPRPYSWITLTHVCKAWRHLALSDSSLWTHIAFTRPEVAQEVVNRSGDRPLTITFSLPHIDEGESHETVSRQAIDEARAFVSQYIERVECLVVPAIADFLSEEQAGQAGRLKTFVGVEPSVWLEDLWQDHVRPAYPLGALRHFETTAALAESFAHFFVPSLRILKMRYRRPSSYDETNVDAYITSVHELGRGLSNMSDLELLDIDLDGFMEGPLNITAKLPKLRELRIIGTLEVTMALFRALTIPRDAIVQLVNYPGQLDQQIGSPVVPDAISRAATNFTSIDTTKYEPIRSLAISFDLNGYHLRGWRGLHDVSNKDHDGSASVYIILPEMAPEADVLTLLSTVPFEHVEVLRLGPFRWDRTPSTVTCLRVLASLPCLTHITLDYVFAQLAWELVALTPANHLHFLETPFKRDPDHNTIHQAKKLTKGTPWL